MELIQVIDSVAREKNIPRDEVFTAMELAMEKVALSKYGLENDIKAQVSRQTGAIELVRRLEVVQTVQEQARQIALTDAHDRDPKSKIGDIIEEALPPMDLGRSTANIAKYVIMQRVRDAERARQYEEFKDRVGELISGVVKRIDHGTVIIDIENRAEAVLQWEAQLPREHFKINDRVRAYIYEVTRSERGPQIFISRRHNQCLAKLFAMEVPEIYDGIIEIKAVARDPGSRSKIAVISHDSVIDPIGACVGVRGSRIQTIVNELQGERIDIIPWSEDPATFVVNALTPAEVLKVVVDEDSHGFEIIVPEDQLSIAIGRRGQNVRLTSQLTGWNIEIMTENEQARRHTEEMTKRTKIFVDALDVDEVLANLLAVEGFASIEDINAVSVDEIANTEGLDADIAQELLDRARAHLTQSEAEAMALCEKKNMKKDLIDFLGLPAKHLLVFAEQDILSLEDFAGLANDELQEIVDLINDESLKQPTWVHHMILKARVAAGWLSEEDIEDVPPPAQEPAAPDFDERNERPDRHSHRARAPAREMDRAGDDAPPASLASPATPVESAATAAVQNPPQENELEESVPHAATSELPAAASHHHSKSTAE
ncbi:MAG: transcription termination factor NusA [Pseudomonadota bacterium]